MNAPLSPRRRRLRWTMVLLAIGMVVGLAGGILVYQVTRPVSYRPDERTADITRTLSRNLPPNAPDPKLTDVTELAGLSGFRNFAGERTSQLPEDMGPGLAWGDYDNDGDDDLFLVSAGGGLNLPGEQLMPCVLFENLGDGTFRRAAGFPELRLRGLGAAWGDYDGDGFLDLVVAGHNAIRLFHNESGSGRFTPDPRLPDARGFWSSATWADYDQDRLLDLYICNYVEYVENDADRDKLSDQIGTAVPFTLNPASYPGGRNALWRQNADGSFTDVSAALNVQNPEGRSLGALWHDFDNDGWLDLYVANDVSDNVFFRNVHGRFEDISHAAWVADYRSAMGLAVGDFDRDGDDDLHVTHWVAQENGLYENLWANLNPNTTSTVQSVTDAGRRDGGLGPTNVVARLSSRDSTSDVVSHSPAPQPLRFVDIADQKGLGQIALPLVGWGTEFVDLDHDGWLDLLVVNGSTIETQEPPPRTLQPQAGLVFWNERGQHFHDLAPLHPELSRKHVSRGLACADFDNDGDQDFVVADLYEGVRLYRNDMASGNWLKIRLRSKSAVGEPRGFGEGSTVIAWLGGIPLRRSVTGVSYLSQHSRTLHWGLGSATRIDRLEIRWHAGATNVFEGLPVNITYEIREGEVLPPEPAVTALSDKERLLRFWAVQRSAMDAMKLEQDNAKAIRLFQEAIALNPKHEDSRYYLGLCLASQGDTDGALAALAELQKLNALSHRAWQQWGVVRALTAMSDADLAAAEGALARARAINPEETGALLVLGELALLRGNVALADQHLAAATHTNPKAVGGFFLRGYMAWKRGDDAAAQEFLKQARGALGGDWQPRGATSEGDVLRKQHVERTPLASCWESWDGQSTPEHAFRTLDLRLSENEE